MDGGLWGEKSRLKYHGWPASLAQPSSINTYTLGLRNNHWLWAEVSYPQRSGILGQVHWRRRGFIFFRNIQNSHLPKAGQQAASPKGLWNILRTDRNYIYKCDISRERGVSCSDWLGFQNNLESHTKVKQKTEAPLDKGKPIFTDHPWNQEIQIPGPMP